MSVSTQGLVRLGHQDAGGAVVGISGAGGRGWEVPGGEDGGYKGLRTMLLRDAVLIARYLHTYINTLQD